MEKTLAVNKSLGELISKGVTFGDVCGIGNYATALALKIGGAMHAIGGNSENHVRDGILILAGGMLVDYSYRAAFYLCGSCENKEGFLIDNEQ